MQKRHGQGAQDQADEKERDKKRLGADGGIDLPGELGQLFGSQTEEEDQCPDNYTREDSVQELGCGMNKIIMVATSFHGTSPFLISGMLLRVTGSGTAFRPLRKGRAEPGRSAAPSFSKTVRRAEKQKTPRRKTAQGYGEAARFHLVVSLRPAQGEGRIP